MTPWWVSVRVAVVVSAASLVVVAALGVTGTGRADVVGIALTGLWASLAAVAVLLAPRSAGLSRRWRTCGLWLALPYGVGQLVLAVEKASVSGVLAFPAAGDLISFLAAPGWFAVLLLVPRPAGPAGRLPRVLADVGVVAVAVGLLFWRIAFTDVHADTATVAASVAVQLLELVILALVVQLVVVTRDRGAALLALAVAMIVTGDLAYSAAVLQDVTLPTWLQGALLSSAWPLVAAALFAVRRPRPRPEVSTEAAASVATVAALALCGGAAVLEVVLRGRGVDATSAVLLVLLLLACTARELVLQRQRVRQVAALSAAADLDPLTGLFNRRALAAALADLASSSGPIGVVVVDLDGFKRVNDVLGHATGDQLVVAVARALRRASPGAVTARLGGDEFALVLPAAEPVVLAAADRLADLVRDCAQEVPGVAGVRVSASVGVVMGERADLRETVDALAVVSRASAAMQEAKRRGRDRVVRHDEVAGRAAREREVVGLLGPALATGRGLVAREQPALDIASGRVVGHRVLLGLAPDVPPHEVLDVARRRSWDAPLARRSLQRAVDVLAATPGGSAWLHLEAHQLHDDAWPTRIEAALREAAAPCRDLVVEVAGRIAEDDARAVRALDRLSAVGVRVAVAAPHAGGGTSLPQLPSLPVDVFVLPPATVAAAQAPSGLVVARALVDAAHGLGLQVLADGVDEPAQLDRLAALGVDLARGALWPAVDATAGPGQWEPDQRESGQREAEEPVVAGSGAPARGVVGQHPQ
ncbi:bifunctional diguanylate cyclase/phosphodiesterase [Quadrisphaera setariae]|uniref:Diguanylate cyclase n=1 Tax=Quadrisphaera setariae TaxID=2593304 RepID=A0A5C8ZDQ9_9ACTN|nr:diguanylate cyclase [Quadrisphaera setariae]TXR55333.1 diguanylate cyclase [Quadrisphaera setariae]